MKSKFIYGNKTQKLFELAKEKRFALPAINVSGTNTINAVLETASEVNSPVIIQFSHGGSHFIAGQGINNSNHNSIKTASWWNWHAKTEKNAVTLLIEDRKFIKA